MSGQSFNPPGQNGGPASASANTSVAVNIPQEYRNIVNEAMMPPPETYSTGKRTRLWMSRRWPRHFKSRNGKMLVASPLRKLSADAFGVSQTFWDWLTGARDNLPRSDDPYYVSTSVVLPTRDDVPQKFQDIVQTLLRPPIEAYVDGRLLSRKWFYEMWPEYFRATHSHILISTSPLADLGWTKLGIPKPYWDWITGKTTELYWTWDEDIDTPGANCDEPYFELHGGVRKPCVDSHLGLDGKQQAHHICESCMDSEPLAMSRNIIDMLDTGFLIPECQDCAASSLSLLQPGFNGCTCDIEVRCFSHRQKYLKHLNEYGAQCVAQAIWGPSHDNPVLQVQYCRCGAPPAIDPQAYFCVVCEHHVVLPDRGMFWSTTPRQAFLGNMAAKRIA
ncbi:uncharacterized protein K452DRAFT_289423 [Aplosporella prunicola CBS 121167]|uniref:Uncharacterized protein n=1 Tax=Aplosporella prunicola CBS 121167 TaxID=1176127 RepID=A0A6A6BAT9_9PEZI|nr:uncharacterized protein K452DRAFT_289423 [Aplosporella prunicola CBS 121167]KAF2140027.1 hypothetical protein K452DRAFT_289423 [Aplosporella prunicola CBS 121167]